MWTAIQFDTHGPDTTWLSESLNAGTLIGVVDGSYDRVKSPNICGTGWILCDSISHQKIAGSFTELSSSASSYRTEMLGLCAMFVLVRAIETQCNRPSASMSISCDNEVAVKRASLAGPVETFSDFSVKSDRVSSLNYDLNMCSLTWMTMFHGIRCLWKNN